MLTALVFSVLMGLVLGLLGGGGSILTLPILLYAVGIEAKSAIATSLLVVGITSLVGALHHARLGHVEWRTGLVFAATAMIGAFGGGILAADVPATALLLGFAGLMLASAIAMLRCAKPRTASVSDGNIKVAAIMLEGLVVGSVTGLVGAGGGFLVVPALVVFGGMSMHAAVGTSLLVIALKSFAGLAGHLSHVSIDLQLAGLISAAAVVGALVGARLSTRVDAAVLRRAFAMLVLTMAVLMLHKELPAELFDAVFVTRWPFWVGGFAVASVVLVVLLSGGKRLGISAGFMDACLAPLDRAARRSWRLPLMVGIVAGGALAASLSGVGEISLSMGMFDTLFGESLIIKAAVFGSGGVMLGFGARLAGGCTSGHGIVGMAQLAPASLISTAAFMVGGFGVTHLALTWMAA